MKIELNIPLEKGQRIYYPDYETRAVCEMILGNVVLSGYTVYCTGTDGTGKEARVNIAEVKETAEEICEHMVKMYLAGVKFRNSKQIETVGPAFINHISIKNEGSVITKSIDSPQ